MVLDFRAPDQGLQEVLLVSGETSPLVTPERLAELHDRGMLARPPIDVKDVGTLLIPSKGQSPGSLIHYLIDIGRPMDFNA